MREYTVLLDVDQLQFQGNHPDIVYSESPFLGGHDGRLCHKKSGQTATFSYVLLAPRGGAAMTDQFNDAVM